MRTVILLSLQGVVASALILLGGHIISITDLHEDIPVSSRIEFAHSVIATVPLASATTYEADEEGIWHSGGDEVILVESLIPALIFDRMARISFLVKDNVVVDWGSRHDATALAYLSFFGLVLAFVSGLVLRDRTAALLWAIAMAVTVGIAAGWSPLEDSIWGGAGHQLAAVVAGLYAAKMTSYFRQCREKPREVS